MVVAWSWPDAASTAAECQSAAAGRSVAARRGRPLPRVARLAMERPVQRQQMERKRAKEAHDRLMKSKEVIGRAQQAAADGDHHLAVDLLTEEITGDPDESSLVHLFTGAVRGPAKAVTHACSRAHMSLVGSIPRRSRGLGASSSGPRPRGLVLGASSSGPRPSSSPTQLSPLVFLHLASCTRMSFVHAG